MITPTNAKEYGKNTCMPVEICACNTLYRRVGDVASYSRRFMFISLE
jgi:hypothetical protein